MIRVVADSNVILDLLLKRTEYFFSRKLAIFTSMGDYEVWMSSSQVSDIFYIASNGGRRSCFPQTKDSLKRLRQHVRVCNVSERDVDRALASRWDDLEDALVYQAATSIGADVIVTHNKDGFELSSIPVMDTEEFFEWLETEKGLIFEEISW